MLKESEILKRLATIKAVVLDMDGVLVDTEPLHMEAFARFLDRLQVPYDDQFLFSFIGYSVPDNIKKIYTEILNVTDLQVIEQGIKQRDQIYLDLLNSTPLKPLAGIEELIAFCKQKNLDLALASSSDWEQIDTIFRNLSKTSGGSFEPQAIFKVVLSGQDVKNRKPDPEIYLKVCRVLEKESQHCLTIEDSPAGVTSAVKAGLTCFALKSHFVEENKLHHAHAVINHIGQVTQWMKKVF